MSRTIELPTRFGWVGLGAMGYPMAKQLSRKLFPLSQFFIFDVNPDPLALFLQETQGLDTAVVVLKSAKDVAEHSVSAPNVENSGD